MRICNMETKVENSKMETAKTYFPRANNENEYFNENGSLHLLIVTCTFHKMLDFIYSHVLLLVTIQLHRPSKQTVSSCWLPLAWEGYCLTCINSVQVELSSHENHRVLFNNYKNNQE